LIEPTKEIAVRPKDIMEFIRVMVASILTFVHRISDMIRDLVGGIRAMFRSIARAVGNAVMSVLRSMENFVRAIGRGIRSVGSVIYQSIRAFVHLIRTVIAQFYYSHILPPLRRVRRYLRYLKRRALIAIRVFIENVRFTYDRARRAFLKVIRFTWDIILRAATRIWGVVVEIFTKIARFFRIIARAFNRLARWTGTILLTIVLRSHRALKRSGPIYVAFVVLAIFAYWYIFVNTYHRISLLILSFILYHFTFDAILLPFITVVISSIVVWINKYHPVLALMRRSGIAFLRVWHTSIAIVAAGRFYFTNHTRKAFGRIIYSLRVFTRRLTGLIARIVVPPVVFLISIVALALTKLRHGWFVLSVFIWLQALRFRERIIHAFRVIAHLVFAILLQIMAILLSIARRIADFIRHVFHIILQGIIFIGGLVKALGRAITTAVRTVWVRILIVIGLITSVVSYIGHVILSGLKAIARAVLFVGNSIKQFFIAVGEVILAVFTFMFTILRTAGKLLVRTALAFFKGIWRIGIALAYAIWYPIHRTRVAFSRTAFAFITGAVIIGTFFITGLITTLMRILMPFVHIMIRNGIALQRVIYTMQVLTVRFFHLIISMGQFIAGSIVGAGKWIVAQAHLHYQGIKDLSLALAPNLLPLVLYLIFGGLVFLILTIAYIPSIITLSFAYKRYKGAETNV
jgi:hypothetical protein